MQKEPPPPPKSREPKKESDKAGQIYARIKTVLMMHAVPPSTFLNIRTLARSLKVSPTPVREALIRLANEDIVMQAPSGRGYFSKPPRIDELVAEYEAAMIVVTHTLLTCEQRLLRAGFSAVPSKRPLLQDEPTSADIALAWAISREDLYLRVARMSDNIVLQRLVQKFVESTRFIRIEDLRRPSRLQQIADQMTSLHACLGTASINDAVARFRDQNATDIELLPELLQGVLRKAAADNLTPEAAIAGLGDAQDERHRW